MLVSTDRNNELLLEVAGRGRIRAKQIEEKLGVRLGEKAEVLCSDAHRSFESFAKKNNLKHVKINASKGERVKGKMYHIQNINNTHHLLKNWMRGFNGVARGYLQNYLNWFRINRKTGLSIDKCLN